MSLKHDVSGVLERVSQSAPDEDVRTEKVAEIRAALAAGTYNVPASALAAKLVDSMLNDGLQTAAARKKARTRARPPAGWAGTHRSHTGGGSAHVSGVNTSRSPGAPRED
jgi:Anti-sigma-28 factor, FlgM